MRDKPETKNVTVVLDAAPRPGADPNGWRTEQICKELLSSDANTKLVFNGPTDQETQLYGNPVEALGLDSNEWWRTTASDVIFLCGNASAQRIASICQTHHPDSLLVVDGSNLLTTQRPDLADHLISDAEKAGRDTVASLRRQRDRELLALANEVWVCSHS